MSEEIKTRVAQYYSQRAQTFGATPAGVDWNGEASQRLRFKQLLQITGNQPYSLNDMGCGYGALLEYLRAEGAELDYLGYDLSTEMISNAKAKFADKTGVAFLCADQAGRQADYAVASGLLSVKQDVAVQDWEVFVFNMINQLHQESRLGFSFNCLTLYSDQEKMKPHLYYGDPCRFFDYCKRNFSRNVALLHDYDLYEFTILVRKGG
ncbi:class I SAM-dependent methyltransferase [Iodobacter fluviatilis]|uniref:Methyltransferase domain n=1 Tax=Iodobacter fluviatilis TaxID=537 RepID=A0A377Q755_9NEIS|nr:class I SAM-dependent methyltransferase [Iodobacter fluviatilis]TCU89206.1 methyltransferase family protein [Iodobacter fluviatilis]STQ90575.1 Methyltransferase domain [Iodobacter fluviatilis]